MADNQKKPMKMDDIMEVIEGLARSTGSYGRLLIELRELEEYDPQGWEDLKAEWEAKEFKDPLDLIFYLEG